MIKKIILGLVMLFILSLVSVNAVDFNNISFTNQEFYNGAIDGSKTVQINNTHLMVVYTKTTNGIFNKVCELDGTNCGSETQWGFMGANDIVSFDIFYDTTNNRVSISIGYANKGYYGYINNDGTWGGGWQYNGGSTNYVSAAQTNSTHFAIGFQDTADVSKGKIIICALGSSSCGTEIDVYTSPSAYIKIIKGSDNKIYYALDRNSLSGSIYKRNLDGSADSFLGSFNPAQTSYIDMIEGSDNKLKIVYKDNGNSNYGTFIDCTLAGSCGSEITFSGTNAGELNSILEASSRLFVFYGDSSANEHSINFNLTGGDFSSESPFMNGSDRIQAPISSIFTSNNQILLSYNNFDQTRGEFAISESLTTSAVVTINQPTAGQYLDNLNFTLNVSTDLNTNLSYSLNGASNVTLGTNINSSVTTKTGIEGLNNLTVYSNYSGTISSDSVTFTIDTINPVINNNIQAEYNSYTISGFNSSCTDVNLASCNISLNSQNVELNTSSFSFTQNGNITYTITAIDLAGNQVTNNGVIFINPYFYVYFTNETNGSVTNFSIDGINYLNVFSEKIYTYGLGNFSFEFTKQGFEDTQFPLSFNLTSDINTSFSIPGAKILFEFFDINGVPIENQSNTTVQIIGDNYATTFTTTNKNYTINDLAITPDTYSVIVSNVNYETVNTLFTFTNQEILTVPIYMTPINLSDVADLIVEVTDLDGNVQSDILTYQYIWDSSVLQYVLINQKITDFSGQTSYKVILNTRSYKFCAEYNSKLFCKSNQIININTAKVIVPIDKSILDETVATDIYAVDFPFSLTNTTNPATNLSLIEFTWANPVQDVDRYYLKVYQIVNGISTLIYSANSTSHTNGLSVNVNLSTGYIFKAKAIIEKDGQFRILDTLTINEQNVLEDATISYGLHKLLALLFLIIGLAVGLSKKVHNITTSHIGITLAYLATALLFPTILSIDIFFIVLLVNVAAYLLYTKRDDIGDQPKFRNLLKILYTYIIMIFVLSFILSDLNDNNLLDDYGTDLYTYLTVGAEAENNEITTFLQNSEQQINLTKDETSPAGEDKTDNTLTTFIKLLGWVNTFFTILSKLFAIPETIYYMMGVKISFLTQFMFYINWSVNFIISYVFYRELFK